ncbi:DUF4129 domain-containing transglutaminase family protein [Lactiplantibacillus nangangensis]|uniref:DUF4129 domain-containing transglutaminase family protein n=1 Tax=Lactiplantibacillus nangangensis TaxID=2559917 RepID=A0ABW1SI28_9LACO|nr:transglutaminase domain-containing protein [Lactiplantibacillus nangangensis]
MPEKVKTALTAALHTGLLALPLTTYTTVNTFQHPWPILIFLVLVNALILLGTWWPRLDLLWIGLIVASFIGSCYASYPLKQAFSFNWAQHFMNNLIQQTSTFRNAGSTQMMPILLSMVLIMALVIALTLLTVRWQQPYLSLLVSLSYLLAVTLFATRNEVSSIAAVVGLAAALLLVRAHPRVTWTNAIYLVLSLALIFAGTTLNTWGRQPLKQLSQQTVAWRNTLSSHGFYNFLEKAAAAKRTGFSEDTTTLGGAIQDDNSVALKVIASQSHYWRVDTRDTYSGQGWEVDKSTKISRKPTLTDSGYLQTPTSPKQAIQVNLAATATYVPVSYGGTTWAVSKSQQKRHGIGYAKQRGRLYINLSKQPLTKLNYAFQPQQYTAAQLKAATGEPTEELDESETDLPAEVPNRVKILSENLIKTAPTQYAKVQALLSYLKNDNRFTYTKMDTPATPNDRDYVDYFLFTSQRGYCDNFSTALVVMLREIGIPARWAQGFTGGSRGQKTKDGRYHYSILNSNAHSWAEVYFTGIGWVPFDPTPGYQNPGLKKATPKATAKTNSSSQQSSSVSSSSPSTNVSSSSEQSTTSSPAAPKAIKKTNRTTALPWLWPSLLGLCLIGGLTTLWLRRYHVWLRLISWQRPWRTPSQSYQQLQHWFEHQLPRAASQTLSVYATRVDQYWPQLHGQFSLVTQQILQQRFGQVTPLTLDSNLNAVIKALQKNPKSTNL